MATQDERPAADVYAIIEEPTTPTGPIRTILLKALAPFGGQMIPGGTHPVVVEKETGKRVQGATAALSVMIDDMQADLGTMSAGEFRKRYLDA